MISDVEAGALGSGGIGTKVWTMISEFQQFQLDILNYSSDQSNVQTHNLLHNTIQVVIPMLAIVALNRHMHLTACSIQTV